jgi:hypothetical protein
VVVRQDLLTRHRWDYASNSTGSQSTCWLPCVPSAARELSNCTGRGLAVRQECDRGVSGQRGGNTEPAESREVMVARTGRSCCQTEGACRVNQLSFKDPEFSTGVSVTLRPPSDGVHAAFLVGGGPHVSRKKVIHGLIARHDGAIVVVRSSGDFDWQGLSRVRPESHLNPWSWFEMYVRSREFDEIYGRAASSLSRVEWHSRAKAHFAADFTRSFCEFIGLLVEHPALSSRGRVLDQFLERTHGQSNPQAAAAAAVLRWPSASDGPIRDRALELLSKAPTLAAIASAGHSTWAIDVRAYLDSRLSWQQLLVKIKSSLGRIGLLALFEGRFSNFSVRDVERSFAVLSALDNRTRHLIFKEGWQREQIALLRSCPSRLYAAALTTLARQPPHARGAALSVLSHVAHGVGGGYFAFEPLRRRHAFFSEWFRHQTSPSQVLDALSAHAREAEIASWDSIAMVQGGTIAMLLDKCLAVLEPFEARHSDAQRDNFLRARMLRSVAEMIEHGGALKHCIANVREYARCYFPAGLVMLAIEDRLGQR